MISCIKTEEGIFINTVKHYEIKNHLTEDRLVPMAIYEKKGSTCKQLEINEESSSRINLWVTPVKPKLLIINCQPTPIEFYKKLLDEELDQLLVYSSKDYDINYYYFGNKKTDRLFLYLSNLLLQKENFDAIFFLRCTNSSKYKFNKHVFNAINLLLKNNGYLYISKQFTSIRFDIPGEVTEPPQFKISDNINQYISGKYNLLRQNNKTYVFSLV